MKGERRRPGGVPALILSAAVLTWAAPVFGAPELRVEGTEFVLTTADGRRLRSADLIGATLNIRHGGRSLEVRIDHVEDDPHAVGGRIVLHCFVAIEGGRAAELCEADAEGRSLGFPMPDRRGGFDLTCTSGSVGKCIRWGYRPWDELPGGPPLNALHQACLHMVHADYGGDGSSMTRDGTTISFCDRFGVRRCGSDEPTDFEAAWGLNGATCVAHPRVADKVNLQQLSERYPRLRDRVGTMACSYADAQRDPEALLFNRSQP